MQILANPFRNRAADRDPATGPVPDATIPFPADDHAPVAKLLARCPAHAPTELLHSAALAERARVGEVIVKDERTRMGLGSFKALGAAHAIARDAIAAGGTPETALTGRTYVTASAGNHGLSVAAGARAFGAVAVVYLAETVPETFAARLEAKGAHVVRAGHDYAASMEAAEKAARAQGWDLLSDSSWEGYTETPFRVMEGYLALAGEIADAMPDPPSHVLLQAGVGGLAAACAALMRTRWGDAPVIVVVEPEAAPALMGSIAAGEPIFAPGPVSSMGRLDCKEPSLIALKGLARDADWFATIGEDEAAAAMPLLAGAGLATTPSGGAGLAALLAAGQGERTALGFSESARILAIVTEEPQ